MLAANTQKAKMFDQQMRDNAVRMERQRQRKGCSSCLWKDYSFWQS